MTRRTIAGALRWLAEQDPAALAVRDERRVLDRAGLIEESERLATVLAGQGVAHDDLVTVRMPNTAEFVTACVAIWMLGATPQPLSRRLPIAEQRAIVELADPPVILGAEAADFPGRATLPDEIDLEGIARWSGPDLAASSWKAPTSSGSTGRPKIVLAGASAHIDPEQPVAAFIPPRAVQLVCGPLSHSAPFTYALRGLMTGHTIVLLPRFSAEAALDAIERHRVSWAMLVPTMMHRMLRLPAETRAAADLSSLQSILHIGARCAEPVKRGWIDWIGAERVLEVYAGSESAGLTLIRGDEWLQRPGSVGRPVGGSRMRVVDPDGAELPPGEIGLVQMRREGPPSYAYLGAEARVVDGWHTLGDLGFLDTEGYLFIADRADDLVNTGSNKVYPAEVEHVLEEHPAVRSALVVGVPDDELGQRLHAVVDLPERAAGGPSGPAGPESPPGADALLAWARARLGAEKAPRSIEVVHEPLRDDAGKARRRAWLPAPAARVEA